MRTPLVAGLAVLALTGAIAAVPRADQPAGNHSAESPGKLLLRHGPGAPVMIAAHRGYWRGAPENSIGAITQAVAHGAQVVEIDVQRTSDGELVLMHDDTVNRTTDGTGRVADLTLAQIKALHLREGLGGAQAAVTGDTVPTLHEAMQAVRRGGTLVNLDKAWAFRDQIYDLLTELGQLGQGLFKSSAPIAEVTAFLDKDPRILYSHVVDDGNAADIGAFTGRTPQAYELIFDRLTDPQIQPAAVAKARATSRVWINTMWYGLAAGYTDEASLRDPALGWAPVVDRHGADVIQTDDEDRLADWLRARARGQKWPTVPEGTVRVQAEDYSTAGKEAGYHDSDDTNSGNAARKYEGVDIGDNAGAIVVGWIQAGEWIRYDVTVPRTGDYRITARVSSPYRPAGRFTLDFGADGVTAPVDVVTTTSHNAFTEQTVGTKRLTRGTHTMVFRVDPGAYQNFNLDYFELTRR
ncbi:glycerophosphodiester phosphodiesterase family protein [Paractinoplanes atraurantiacus]|uniref:Glycerophosphoryl diester phosphodiesterase n=1 Tax=Paractinoplanes atraurantiacus TaxID=1036182 RepID=A0A285GR15_9ACTN|nr:glycerophosphodiester phosphodiesterase family protein [Actinoplanes atraurantiacus]SNY26012.1 glycerophosphoryl diester phosphodiesterase [Actinoplanes atraurantiacus]